MISIKRVIGETEIYVEEISAEDALAALEKVIKELFPVA